MARRVNSSTASERARGASSKTTSPSMSSGTWLVHRIRSAGAASRRRTARAAAASMTCSQLSRITRSEEVLSRSNSAASPPGPSTALIKHVDHVVGRGRGLEPGQPDAVGRDPRSRRAARGRPRSRPPSSRCLPVPRSPRAAHRRAGRRRPPPPSRDRRARQSSTAGSRPAMRRRRRPRGGGRGRVTASWTRIRCSSSCSCGRGSSPSSSASWCLTRWYVARASAWRPGSVQRGDQQLPQALLERVRRDRSLRAHRSTSATSPSRNRAVNWISRSCRPRLFEPGAVRVDPFAVAGCLQHVPAVQLQASTHTDPRHARSSPASSRPDAAATAPSTAIASTSDGSTASA